MIKKKKIIKIRKGRLEIYGTASCRLKYKLWKFQKERKKWTESLF